MRNPEAPLPLSEPIIIQPDHHEMGKVRGKSVGRGRLQREFYLMTPGHRQIMVGLVLSGLTLAGGLVSWEAGAQLNSQTLKDSAELAALAGVAGGVASVLALLNHRS